MAAPTAAFCLGARIEHGRAVRGTVRYIGPLLQGPALKQPLERRTGAEETAPCDHATALALGYITPACTLFARGEAVAAAWSDAWFTSPLYAGIDWDDANRGKHDGTFKGVRYFQAHAPTSGSFVPLAALAATGDEYAFAREFWDQLVDKYCGEPDVDPGQWGGREVETIGWQKVMDKQRRLNELVEVAVQDRAIGYTRHTHLEQRLSALEILDLSRNLFASWADIFYLVCQLPRLTQLRVSHNRGLPCPPRPVSSPSPLESAQNGHPQDWTRERLAEASPLLENVTILIMSHVHFAWQDMAVLSSIFPNLTDVVANANGFAQLSPFYAFPSTQWTSMRLLELEHNQLDDWEDISLALGRLPQLDHLVLRGNRIKRVFYVDGTFLKLRKLNLIANQLEDWVSVHALNAFPALRAVRLYDNPITETVTPQELLGVLTARIGNMTEINNSTVKPRHRLNAELYYVNRTIEALVAQAEQAIRAETLQAAGSGAASAASPGIPSPESVATVSQAMQRTIETVHPRLPALCAEYDRNLDHLLRRAINPYDAALLAETAAQQQADARRGQVTTLRADLVKLRFGQINRDHPLARDLDGDVGMGGTPENHAIVQHALQAAMPAPCVKPVPRTLTVMALRAFTHKLLANAAAWSGTPVPPPPPPGSRTGIPRLMAVAGNGTWHVALQEPHRDLSFYPFEDDDWIVMVK